MAQQPAPTVACWTLLDHSPKQQQCRNGTRLCGKRCVSPTDPAACGPTCTRCPKPAANGIATCSKKGVCGVSCAKGYERAAAAGKVVKCRPVRPANTTTACGPGTQPEGASCSVCPANTTKAGTNADKCQPCPDGSRTFGNNASDHDEPSDCYAGGLIASRLNTGAAVQPLLDFDDQLRWSVDNTGPKKPGTPPKRRRSGVCLYACDDAQDVDLSIKVAHIAGSPAVYAFNDPSLVRSGVSLVSAIRDQQRCGTCVSHALASTAETACAAAMRIDARGLNFSHTFSYFCANHFENVQGGARSCATGWDLMEALAAMKAAPAAFSMNSSCLRPGVNPAQLPDAQLKAFCTADVPAACKSPGFTCDSKALSDSVSQIQRYIRLHGSVVTRVIVSDSFMKFFKENPKGVFRGSNSSTDDKLSLVHAVQLIGYNNEEMFWLAKQSWGSDWGDQGLFRVAMSVAEVGHPEDTFALVDCFTTSKDPATVAAWSDRWPVIADERPGCVLYTATARDTISGISDHFQVDILGFVDDNTKRGVIPTLELGDPPRPEPQLQPDTSWAGTVFRVCNIASSVYNRVATDPCNTNPSYCNGRQTSCAAGRCVCRKGYAGLFCELDNKLRKFSLPSGEAYVLHVEPPTSWPVAQQRCKLDGMRLARLYSRQHASEVYKQVKQLTSATDEVWIGLNDVGSEGAYAWVGGNSSSDVNETPNDVELWWGNEPNNGAIGSGEDCVTFSTYRVFPELNLVDGWNDAPCSMWHAFLCGPAEESIDPCVRFPCSSGGTRPAIGCMAAAAGDNSSNSVNGRQCRCDEGLSYVSDELGCVAPPVFDVAEFQLAGVDHALFVSPTTTWTEASRICRARGMALVKIATEDYARQLHQTVATMLVERGVGIYAYWIGLNDRASEGSFVWASDGTRAAYARWDSSQPDDFCSLLYEDGTKCRVPGEDCVTVGQSGLWSDERSWSQARFVCVQVD